MPDGPARVLLTMLAEERPVLSAAPLSMPLNFLVLSVRYLPISSKLKFDQNRIFCTAVPTGQFRLPAALARKNIFGPGQCDG